MDEEDAKKRSANIATYIREAVYTYLEGKVSKLSEYKNDAGKYAMIAVIGAISGAMEALVDYAVEEISSRDRDADVELVLSNTSKLITAALETALNAHNLTEKSFVCVGFLVEKDEEEAPDA